MRLFNSRTMRAMSILRRSVIPTGRYSDTPLFHIRPCVTPHDPYMTYGPPIYSLYDPNDRLPYHGWPTNDPFRRTHIFDPHITHMTHVWTMIGPYMTQMTLMYTPWLTHIWPIWPIYTMTDPHNYDIYDPFNYDKLLTSMAIPIWEISRAAR